MRDRIGVSLAAGLALAALVLGAAGCTQFFMKAADDPDAGVPLTRFTATNGNYFPAFVQRFFSGAAQYARAFPTLTEARADVQMIEIRPLDDGNQKLNEANLSWSADGVYLGYEVLEGGFRKIMVKDLTGGYSRELQVVPKGTDTFLDGMVARQIQSYNAGLRWSRDSTRFAFMSNGGVGQYKIYVGAIGAPDELPVSSSHTKDGYATWSPTTNEIAFVSARSGNGDIYAVALSSKKVSRLSESPAVDIFPEWFPDGNHIVYASGDALNHDLWIVDRGGRQAPWRAPWPLTRWSVDELRPTVSPDGSLVAFYASTGGQAEGEGERWDVVVVPFVAGRTYGPAELRNMVIAKDVVIDLNTGPAWSPDSRKIFFVKRDPSVANPIYAYDLYTGRNYMFKTGTRMNRDILMSRLGILSFRAQVGVWDRVFVALTNQGQQLQGGARLKSKIHYQTM